MTTATLPDVHYNDICNLGRGGGEAEKRRRKKCSNRLIEHCQCKIPFHNVSMLSRCVCARVHVCVCEREGDRESGRKRERERGHELKCYLDSFDALPGHLRSQ